MPEGILFVAEQRLFWPWEMAAGLLLIWMPGLKQKNKANLNNLEGADSK